MSLIDDLREGVHEDQRAYRHPRMPLFEFCSGYDLFPERDTRLTASRSWPKQWEHGGRAGIYAVCDERGELLYVGKASARSSLGARLTTSTSWVAN